MKRWTAYATCKGCGGRFVLDTHRTRRECPKCKLSWVGMHELECDMSMQFAAARRSERAAIADARLVIRDEGCHGALASALLGRCMEGVRR